MLKLPTSGILMLFALMSDVENLSLSLSLSLSQVAGYDNFSALHFPKEQPL